MIVGFVAGLIVLLCSGGRVQDVNATELGREGHASGHTRRMWVRLPSVREFVAKCKRANIDTIVMDIKGWPVRLLESKSLQQLQRVMNHLTCSNT
jgi:hypothetical protein